MRIELRLRTEAAGGSAACKFQFCNQQQDGMVWDGGREGREATHHWIPNLALIQFYVWSRWKSRVPEEEPKRGRESQQNPPNANEPRTMKMGDDRLWALHSRRRMKCTREQGGGMVGWRRAAAFGMLSSRCRWGLHLICLLCLTHIGICLQSTRRKI